MSMPATSNSDTQPEQTSPAPSASVWLQLRLSSRNEKFSVTVALSFVCGKYYSIMDWLGSKDSSRDLQSNCIISFYFCLYLMFHACATRFDVIKNLKNFLIFGETKQGLKLNPWAGACWWARLTRGSNCCQAKGHELSLPCQQLRPRAPFACGGGYVAQLAMPAPPRALFILLQKKLTELKVEVKSQCI